MMNFGKAIRLVRVAKGLRQVDLAEGICTANHLSLVERQKRAPSIQLIEKIADALDIPVDMLVYLAIDWNVIDGKCDDQLLSLSAISNL